MRTGYPFIPSTPAEWLSIMARLMSADFLHLSMKIRIALEKMRSNSALPLPNTNRNRAASTIPHSASAFFLHHVHGSSELGADGFDIQDLT